MANPHEDSILPEPPRGSIIQPRVDCAAIYPGYTTHHNPEGVGSATPSSRNLWPRQRQHNKQDSQLVFGRALHYCANEYAVRSLTINPFPLTAAATRPSVARQRYAHSRATHRNIARDCQQIHLAVSADSAALASSQFLATFEFCRQKRASRQNSPDAAHFESSSTTIDRAGNFSLSVPLSIFAPLNSCG